MWVDARLVFCCTDLDPGWSFRTGIWGQGTPTWPSCMHPRSILTPIQGRGQTTDTQRQAVVQSFWWPRYLHPTTPSKCKFRNVEACELPMHTCQSTVCALQGEHTHLVGQSASEHVAHSYARTTSPVPPWAAPPVVPSKNQGSFGLGSMGSVWPDSRPVSRLVSQSDSQTVRQSVGRSVSQAGTSSNRMALPAP